MKMNRNIMKMNRNVLEGEKDFSEIPNFPVPNRSSKDKKSFGILNQFH